MKLIYKQGSQEFSTGGVMNAVVTEEVLSGAMKVLGIHFGVPVPSVEYLLQNGWSQSLQDSFAGPRAKAIADKESEETVNAVILAAIEKRIKSIKEGALTAGTGGGRDPIRSVAKAMLEATTRQADHANFGKKLPKDKAKLKTLLDRFVEKHLEEIKAEVIKRRASKTAAEVDLDDLEVE